MTNVSTVTFDFDLDGAGNGHFAGLMSPPSAFSQTHQSYWPTLGNGCDHLNGGLLTSNITSAVYAAAYAVTSIDFNGYGHVFRWSGSALSADNQQTECTWTTGSGDGMWVGVSSIGGSFTATLS